MAQYAAPRFEETLGRDGGQDGGPAPVCPEPRRGTNPDRLRSNRDQSRPHRLAHTICRPEKHQRQHRRARDSVSDIDISDSTGDVPNSALLQVVQGLCAKLDALTFFTLLAVSLRLVNDSILSPPLDFVRRTFEGLSAGGTGLTTGLLQAHPEAKNSRYIFSPGDTYERALVVDRRVHYYGISPRGACKSSDLRSGK